MANTFIQIGSTITVGSGGSSTLDFSSIPATYTDLVLKMSVRGTTTSPDRDALLSNIKFNNTSTTYSATWIAAATNTFSFGGGALAGYVNASSWTAGTFASNEIYIPNYAGSQQKTFAVVSAPEQNVTNYDSKIGMGANLWNGTGAINQITIGLDYGNFAQHSTASLYGILKS
jgi:hypothetical protein